MSALATLYPPGVLSALSATDAADTTAGLWPEEEGFVARAVPKRRREFTTGRLLARDLLAKFGVADFPLLAGSDRAPIWPEGLVGSISHTRELCGVVIARRGTVKSVGLDIETAEPLKQELWRLVIRPEERSWLEQRHANERGRLAKLIFSAKECAYKCQYPLTRTWLDFQDAKVTVDLAAKSLVVEFQKEIDPAKLGGKYFFSGAHVHVGMVYPSG